MSEYRNSKKLNNFDYKSENFSFTDEKETNMCPNTEFKHQILKNVNGHQEGDVKCEFKELEKKETVSEEYKGAYIPKGRNNLAKNFEAFKAEVKQEIANLGKSQMSSKLGELTNSAVQLFNIIVKNFISSNMSSEENKKYKNRDLNFEAIEKVFTDPVRLEKIKSSKAYNDLAWIYNNDKRFNRIRARRNKFIHPETLDIEDIISNQNEIIDEYLESEDKALLTELKHVIKKLLGEKLFIM